jgi:hypothetical protein
MACVVGQYVYSNDSNLYNSGNMGIPMATGHEVNNDSGLYSGNMGIPMVTGHLVNNDSGFYSGIPIYGPLDSESAGMTRGFVTMTIIQ